MGSKDSPGSLSLSDVVRGAIESAAVCRLYVLEKDAKFPRIVEGVPRSIATARDGRERVVLGIDTAMEHSEVRVPLDRVVRVEQLDGNANVVPGRCAGEVPHDRPAPTFSAPQQRRVDDPNRTRTPEPAPRVTAPRTRAAKPSDRDTQPITQPDLVAQVARRTGPHVDDKSPTQPAMPRPRRRS